MPAPQLTPPGYLEWHAPLVAATPALLALTTGAAASLIGASRSARAIGWVGMLAGLALLAVMLRERGMAAAFTDPIAHGWMRVGTWQVAAALLSGVWAACRWRPGPARDPLAWGAATALSAVLPLVLLPLALLLLEPARRRAPPGHLWPRWRTLRPVLVIGLGVAACWCVPGFGAARLPARLPMAVACALAAIGAGAWTPPLVLAALAAVAPLPD
jgi:hypothetical protein